MIRNRPYENEDSGLVALVTTPIGNRDDITLRALNFLKEADIIACEDTRNTSLLLSYYGIKNKKYVSLYAQTEAKEAHALVLSVKKNKQKLAYCSDAGMPGISDPGAILVQACHEENVPVTLLPGPTASLSALVLSGIDSADFSFYGFLPTKAGQIKTMLTSLKDRKETRWHSFAENLDYPEKSGEWLKYVNSKLVDGQLQIIYRDLVGKETHYEHND